MTAVRIFLFEDNQPVRETMTQILKTLEYEVCAYPSPGEVMAGMALCPRRDRMDLVITDIKMPMVSGLELADRLMREGFDPANIAVMSGYWIPCSWEMAGEMGVKRLVKPFRLDALTGWIDTRRGRAGGECLILDREG